MCLTPTPAEWPSDRLSATVQAEHLRPYRPSPASTRGRAWLWLMCWLHDLGCCCRLLIVQEELRPTLLLHICIAFKPWPRGEVTGTPQPHKNWRSAKARACSAAAGLLQVRALCLLLLLRRTLLLALQLLAACRGDHCDQNDNLEQLALPPTMSKIPVPLELLPYSQYCYSLSPVTTKSTTT